MMNTRRLSDAIDLAIRNWAERYDDEMLARVRGKDATAFRLRMELCEGILKAIKIVDVTQ
jgi:hypothetical protein